MGTAAQHALRDLDVRVTRGSAVVDPVQLDEAVRLLLRHGTRHQRWKDDQAQRFGTGLTVRQRMDLLAKHQDFGRVYYRKDW